MRESPQVLLVGQLGAYVDRDRITGAKLVIPEFIVNAARKCIRIIGPFLLVVRQAEAAGDIGQGAIMGNHITVEINGPQTLFVGGRMPITTVPTDAVIPAGIKANITAGVKEEPIFFTAPLFEPEFAELDELWINLAEKTVIR